MSNASSSQPNVGEKRKKVKKGAGQPWYQNKPNAAVSTMVDDDGRPLARQRTQYAPQTPQDAEEMEDTDTLARAELVDGFTYLMGQPIIPDASYESSDDSGTRVEVSNLPKLYDSARNPMKVWRGFSQSYLERLLALDGTFGMAGRLCTHCHKEGSVAQFRCQDNGCFGLGLVCSDCIVDCHAHAPLHWVEQWNGHYFKTVTLKELGLKFTVGHSTGGYCPWRHVTSEEFVVIHTNGVHVVDVGFCGCQGSEHPRDQLIEGSLWPATPDSPKTAISFPLLRLAHNLNCNGKLPTWDLWKGLESLTEERLGYTPLNRYRALLRCLRQWRYLQLCLNAGRANDPSGISGTSPGELATTCPACPHPGKNIPDDYATNAVKRWLYILFLSTDANYRLRNAMVSTPERDPPLGDGMAYFVPSQLYEQHIRKYVSQDEMSNCSGFQALFLANIKNAKGLRVSGVTGITCARHGCWRPNGIGNLQRGERFCNVDYVAGSSVRNVESDVELFFTYDIVCIWKKKFTGRLLQMPPEAQIVNPDRLRFAIPKFHFWAHQPKDHARYSLNFLPSVGRTNGELIEQNWSHSNRAAAQTKVMGPGARQDTLDDVFNYHNLRTIAGLERVLPSRLVDALKNSVTHTDDFKNFDQGMESLFGRETVDSWLRLITAWESDADLTCPFEPEIRSTMTVNEVRIQMAKEDQLELAKTPGAVVSETTASSLTIQGTEIEDLQRALAWEVKARTAGATYQDLNIQKQRTLITRRIRKFRTTQRVYMPHLREYLTADQLKHLDAPADVIHPEEVKLFLPSELTPDQRSLSRCCKDGQAEIEERLREAECHDALDDLRRALRTRSAGLLFQVRNVSGQTSTTRAEGHQRRVLINVNLAKLRYRWARNALYRLRGHGTWENELRILEDKHVTGINERMLTAREEEEAADIRLRGLIYIGNTGPSSLDALVSEGEGRREVSWIWYSYPKDVDARTQTTSAAFNDTLRIEWSKARARMLRWREEVELILEEMRRVIAYRRWKASWWNDRTNCLPNASAALKEGAQARALASADRERSLADRLDNVWSELRLLGQEVLADLPLTRTIDVAIDAAAEKGYHDEHEEDDTIPDENEYDDSAE